MEEEKPLFIVQHLRRYIRYNIYQITTFVVLPAVLSLFLGNSQAQVDNCTTLRYKHDRQCLKGGSDSWKDKRNEYASGMSANDADILANDITIFWNELTDRDEVVGGRDHTGDNIDDADAAFLGTHGSCIKDSADCDDNNKNECTCENLTFRLTTESGNPTNRPCHAVMTHMNVGNDGVMFVAAHACSSAEQTAALLTLRHTRYLHQWHGYYGTTKTGAGDMEEYVDDAFDGSASYAWIENAVKWGCMSSGQKDCCPISMLRGANEFENAVRLYYEDFTTDFGHPYGNAITSHYYGSCDPRHANNYPPPNGMGMEDHFGFN